MTKANSAVGLTAFSLTIMETNVTGIYICYLMMMMMIIIIIWLYSPIRALASPFGVS
jgi:hypothetical protein